MTKKKNSAIEGGLWLIILLPLLYLLSVWNSLPDLVPTHFNVHGVADDFSSKPTLIWLIGGSGIGIYLLMKYLPAIDPKNKLLQMGGFDKIRLVIQLFISAIGVIMILAAQNSEINTTQMVVFALVLLTTVLGNYLQNIKPNYFIGIRTPWTLENEKVWRKTHQLAGRVWFFGGLILLPFMVFIPANYSLYLVLAYVLGSALYFVVYSYKIYQVEKG